VIARALSVATLAALLGGCSDDPPTIRNLIYSPNAALVGQEQTINGMVDYSDSDNDISQYVVQLVDPNNNLLVTSQPMPISNTGMGVTGQVPFTIMFTPGGTGLFRFIFWIIDLPGRPSNKLQGLIRVS
jgi:hypothetical protein